MRQRYLAPSGGLALPLLVVLAVALASCTSTAVPKSHSAASAPAGSPVLIRDERAACGSSLSAVSRTFGKGNQQCEIGGFLFELLPNLFSGREPSGQAKFWRACKAHDICYLTPGTSKSECDRQFLQGMRRECDLASTNSLRWVCHGECNLAARQYHRFASTTNTSYRSFSVAQEEAAAVRAGLPQVEGTEAPDRRAETAALIGEACFWISQRGRCLVVHAAEWVAARLAGSELTPVEWMEAKGIARLGSDPEGTATSVPNDVVTRATPRDGTDTEKVACTDKSIGSERHKPWNLLPCQ